MYELQYIEGLRSPLTSFLLLGRSFHKAIETANRAKMEWGEIMDVSDVQNAFSDEWDRGKSDVEWEEGEKEGEIKDSGLNMTALYYEQVGQHLKPVMIEQGATIDVEGVPVKVVIDLVEKNGLIRDFKTAKRTPSQDEADKSIQLATYALAYRQMTGLRESGAVLDYTVNLKSGPKIKQLETIIDDGRIERTRNLIKGVAKAISAGLFYPVEEGMACGFCAFRNVCKGGGY